MRGRIRLAPERSQKNSEKSVISRLTLQNGPPIYRAHAARKAMNLRAVLFLCMIEFHVEKRLFDIVIVGRGTWAAVLFAIPAERPVNE
jgi:hypothetical protein